MGGVSFVSQLIGVSLAIIYALLASAIIYSVFKGLFGIRLSEHQEMIGADLSIHNIEAYPEEAL